MGEGGNGEGQLMDGGEDPFGMDVIDVRTFVHQFIIEQRLTGFQRTDRKIVASEVIVSTAYVNQRFARRVNERVISQGRFVGVKEGLVEGRIVFVEGMESFFGRKNAL